MRQAGGLLIAGLAVCASSVFGNPSSPTLVVYAPNDSLVPVYRVWNGSGWGAATNMTAVTGYTNWVVLRNCPTRDETACATLDQNSDVTISFFTGSSPGTPTKLCADTGTASTRCFDICYESVSGKLLIVYYDKASSKLAYRTYNGTTLSGASQLALSSSSQVNYVSLARSPISNEIVMACNVDGNKGNGVGNNSIYVAKWQGSSWTSVTEVTNSSPVGAPEDFAVAYEQTSGEAMIVYATGNNKSLKYRTSSSSSWSSEQNLGSVTGVPQFVRLASDPASDGLICACLDNEKDVNAAYWNGNAWGSVASLEPEVGWSDRRQLDVCFTPEGSKGLIVYEESGVQQPRYRTWNGSTWSDESYGSNTGDLSPVIALAPGVSGNDIFELDFDDADDLNARYWNGSTLSSHTELNGTIEGGQTCQSFMMSTPVTPPPTPANIPYSNDFETAMGAEWSNSSRDYTATFTNFAGRHRAGPLKLSLYTTPGETYRVAFDFYAIDSWDGTNTGGTNGPDVFKVSVDGTAVFSNTFTHEYPSQGATYPYPYDQMGSYGFNSSYKDAIYRKVEAVFTATRTVSKISFAGELVDPSNQGFNDESWGIDNISVDTARFSDVTTAKGFTAATSTSAGSYGGGIHWADFDNDGDLDCLITGNAAAYLKNTNAGASFTPATFVFANFQRQAALLDIDNDGDMDIWGTAIASNDAEGCAMNAGGAFSNAGALGFAGGVTNEACAAADINRDGFCDLAMFSADGNWKIIHQGGSTPSLSGSNSAGDGMNTSGDYGNGDYCSSGDINNDGYPDFFYHYGTCKLFISRGDGTYTSNTQGISITTSAATKFGSAWGDYDNDGDLDLFCARMDEACSGYLWRNDRNWTTGSGGFTNVTAAAGLTLNTAIDYTPDLTGTRSCCWGDYNNDGYLDLLVVGAAGAHYLYKNNGDGTFTRSNEGLVATGSFIDGAFVDYDNDGDLDIVLSRENGAAVLFENRTNNANYLKVRVVGRGQGGTNTAAIGTRVELWNSDGTVRLGRRDVGSARGFGGTECPWLHFGGVNRSSTYKLKVYLASRGASDPYTVDVVPANASTTIGTRTISQMVTVTEPNKSKIIQWSEVRNRAP